MPTFYIEQFGCRATQADGAALERQLRGQGCALASKPEAADFVVVNTCTVTAAADAQARDSIRKIHAQNPGARLIVTGCYAQRAPEELAALPGVAWVVGNSHKPQIPHLIDNAVKRTTAQPEDSHFVAASRLRLSSQPPLSAEAAPNSPAGSDMPNLADILVGDVSQRSKFLFAPLYGGEGHHTRPTLKIQDGCDSRCAYCVIPFVRGKSRSLPPESVIEQIQRLVGQAFLLDRRSPPTEPSLSAIPPAVGDLPAAREIVLSGINLGTYGRDLSPRVEFIDLLRRILDETQIERLRISSIEPLDVTQDLISLFASTGRIAQHFHMPLQSGSDRILGAMYRWYRTEHYARRLELIREELPHAAIGADVIAGFPGETQADHDATCAFIERLPFTYLHVFSFSSRPGTRAATLPDHVPAIVVKQRARELRALGEDKAAAFRRSQIGRTLRVLTLRADQNDALGSPAETTPAISSNYLRVQAAGRFEANRWLDVTVSAERAGSLLAE